MTEIKVLLECLIDELRHSQQYFTPSEWTLEVLSRYENHYDFVKQYLDELME